MHTAEIRRATRRTDELNIASYLYKPMARRLLDSVALALQHTPTTPAAQTSEPVHPEPPGLAPLAILLVEDLEDNRDLITLFLNTTHPTSWIWRKTEPSRWKNFSPAPTTWC